MRCLDAAIRHHKGEGENGEQDEDLPNSGYRWYRMLTTAQASRSRAEMSVYEVRTTRTAVVRAAWMNV